MHLLGEKRILRTKDAYDGPVAKPEIEDLLRGTLIRVAKDEFGWDINDTAESQPGRPVIKIFDSEVKGFSKYKLAKAYIRWTSSHEATDLGADELNNWVRMIDLINKALK